MGYATGSYTSKFTIGGISTGCNTGYFWFPSSSIGTPGDFNDGVRNEISNEYFYWFGRYAESSAMEGWVSDWVYEGGPAIYGTIREMIRQGGVGSGELNAVNTYGKHTGMTVGACPVLIYFYINRQDGLDAGTNSVPFGQSVTMSWLVTGATSNISIVKVGATPASAPQPGTVSSTGTYTFTPPVAGTYTYQIRITSPGGTLITSNFGFVVTNPPPPSVSISASPSAIIRGQSSSITWSISGANGTITDIGFVTEGSTGPISVSPISTRTYTITATNAGGTRSASTTVTVYQPPNVTFSLDKNPIIRGESTVLRWTTTGDASTAYVFPGVGQTNLNSFVTVSPTTTTTYSISVSGLGGSDSDQITLTVYQPPSVKLIGPPFINYNDNPIVLNYEAYNVETSLTLYTIYEYFDSYVSSPPQSLPTATSASGQINVSIPYTNKGPKSIQYRLEGIGNGGQSSKTINVSVNIDETPDNIIIPPSEDKLKNEDPVVTPDEIVTSYEIQVNDIDIPVEIKANRPIQVDVNDQDNWKNVRSI